MLNWLRTCSLTVNRTLVHCHATGCAWQQVLIAILDEISPVRPRTGLGGTLANTGKERPRRIAATAGCSLQTVGNAIRPSHRRDSWSRRSPSEFPGLVL